MRTHVIPTNHNNKLDCKAFLVIDEAPTKSVAGCQLNAECLVHTKDNSHIPVKARLRSLHRLKLGEMVDCFSIPSHGMDAFDFIEWYKKNNPDKSPGHPLAVYIYVKE